VKTILCYGDSNTWGWDPIGQTRYPMDVRWPGVLRQELGEGYLVIEEGLGGRTTVWDDPIEGYKNGKTYLIPCLQSHSPLDLVIILLGTNDLKMRFSLSAFGIAYGASALVDVVQKSDAGPNYNPPQVLLLAPPPLVELSGDTAEIFQGGVAKSLKFSQFYRRVAQERGCAFLDTAEVIVSSKVDGVHFEASEHRKLGLAVAAKVREILG
jgi:lysophospholipase L1-like esterase